MIYVRQPTAQEREELERMTRREVGRVSRRAQMVLLSAQRRTVPEIAAIFGASRPRVRHWLGRFEEGGPGELRDAPRSGRPRKMAAAVEAHLLELIDRDPKAAGYVATFWTVAMLALALSDPLGVAPGVGAVRGSLHRLGLRWGRPRLAMPRKTDPEKAAKQWRIAEAVVAAGPQATVLYADESRVQLLPLVRALWHRVGQQVRIPTPGSNKTRAVFGALEIRTGSWSYLVRERLYAEDFVAFLEHLLLRYPSYPIVLIVDNYSSHTAHSVAAWLAAHPRIQLHFLPTYCSHLNPVEAIWRRMKDAVAADRLHGSMPLLLESVDEFFQAMTPERALRWAA